MEAKHEKPQRRVREVDPVWKGIAGELGIPNDPPAAIEESTAYDSFSARHPGDEAMDNLIDRINQDLGAQ